MLSLPARTSGQRHMRRRATSMLPRRRARGIHETGAPFAPLIDAKAAARLLGVPHTWLLAQARAGRIPHHRLGHYVRFSADDLRQWLGETRIGDNRLGGAYRSR
jgi:excisionase family DNA binding protein